MMVDWPLFLPNNPEPMSFKITAKTWKFSWLNHVTEFNLFFPVDGKGSESNLRASSFISKSGFKENPNPRDSILSPNISAFPFILPSAAPKLLNSPVSKRKAYLKNYTD